MTDKEIWPAKGVRVKVVLGLHKGKAGRVVRRTSGTGTEWNVVLDGTKHLTTVRQSEFEPET